MASKIQKELALIVTGRDVSGSKTLRGVSREMRQLNQIAGKAGSNVARNLERTIVVGAAAAAGAIGFAIKTAQSFESATAGVAKTVDGDISTIVTGLEKMSTTAPIAYEELAAIAEAGGALGVAKGDLLAFTDTVAKLGITTDLTSESAATSLGHLKTNLKLTGEAFAHVGNTVVDLGNKGASTESQILGMAEGVSGVAGIVGLSTPQVLGWGAAWANTGEEIEAGSTEMQKLFLETFGMVNAGGPKLQLLAKIAGTTSKDFAAAYRKDASGAVSDFLVKLGRLDKATQAATLERLGFTDIRITRGLLKILGNTDNLTDSLGIATKAWADNNAMQIEAEKRFKTSANQMKILENNVRLAAATVGTELLPIINELAKEGVDWLGDHQAEIKEFGKDLAEGIRDAVTWAKSLDWAAIGAALGTAADAAKLIVSTFMAMPAPLQQLLAGGFVANKLTGGAVGDLAGLVGKIALTRLGITAAVVNVTGGVVKGGGIPTPGGGSGWGGLLKNVLKIAIPAAVVVGAIEAGVATAGINDPRHQQIDPKTGRSRTFRGTNVAEEQLANLRKSREAIVRTGGSPEFVARQLAIIDANIAKLTGPALPAAIGSAVGGAVRAGMTDIDREIAAAMAATHGALDSLIGQQGGAFLRAGDKAGTLDENAGKLVELFKSSTNPSLRSMQANLGIMIGLAKEGDPKTRAALSDDIKALQALIDTRLTTIALAMAPFAGAMNPLSGWRNQEFGPGAGNVVVNVPAPVVSANAVTGSQRKVIRVGNSWGGMADT